MTDLCGCGGEWRVATFNFLASCFMYETAASYQDAISKRSRRHSHIEHRHLGNAKWMSFSITQGAGHDSKPRVNWKRV